VKITKIFPRTYRSGVEPLESGGVDLCEHIEIEVTVGPWWWWPKRHVAQARKAYVGTEQKWVFHSEGKDVTGFHEAIERLVVENIRYRIFILHPSELLRTA
jgi:hypothetical protein